MTVAGLRLDPMEIIELRTVDARRNIEWEGTLEDFLDGARAVGHAVAKLHGIDGWIIFNPVSMAWCEVSRPAVIAREA